MLKHQRYQSKSISIGFQSCFLLKPDFQGSRNNAKKEVEESHYYVIEELHEESDHANTFLKTIKGRTSNNLRDQVKSHLG
jgi:hypothetical protein